MNRRIAAWTIAAVAVLGLTACSASPAAEDDKSDDAGDSAPVEETNTDQSVEEACGIVLPKVEEASTASASLASADPSNPQAAIDQFNAIVETFGEATDSVSNTEVKEATSALHENYVALGEVFEKVMSDPAANQDAMTEVQTITADLTESATALQELCS